MKKDFLSNLDFSAAEIKQILKLSADLKKKKGKSLALKGKSVGLIFHKPSLRTRISFEVGVFQLGGDAVYITEKEIELGKRETIPDAARVLSRYLDMIVIRTFSQDEVGQLAESASIPIINGLTDLLHPCQILSDLFTIYEKKKKFENLTIAYVGDGNNVVNSWLELSQRIPMELRIGTAKDTMPDGKILRDAMNSKISKILVTSDPVEAVKNADVIYTDVWASMGQKHLADNKANWLRGFQVNSNLVRHARKDCIIMHCLPANRGEEITDEAMDSPNSVVFDQAENRLHVQKAIMIKLVSKK
ncbi:MAG: ornithine carbamoyltransferase [candidate division Zixibacteria bacterium RBG_19FT_COMBO_42_43]|nr:MAG: ornithine carbamoyltransferase [candidate division Zixibacteria bacterium RBG_19FT_COMBO_42_43]